MTTESAAAHNSAVRRALNFLKITKGIDDGALRDLVQVDLPGGSGSHENPTARELGVSRRVKRMSGDGNADIDAASDLQPQTEGGMTDLAERMDAMLGEFRSNNKMMKALLALILKAATDDEDLEADEDEDPDAAEDGERGAAATEKALQRLTHAKTTTPREMFNALGFGGKPKGVLVRPPVFKSRGPGAVTPELVQTRIEEAMERGEHEVVIGKAQSLLGRFVAARKGTYDTNAFVRELELSDSSVTALFEPPVID